MLLCRNAEGLPPSLVRPQLTKTHMASFVRYQLTATILGWPLLEGGFQGTTVVCVLIFARIEAILQD